MKRLLALFLLLAALCSLAACGASQPIEDTPENRRAAMIETALAYYYHNPDIQYDNRMLLDEDIRSRRDNSLLPPECAGSDVPLFSVCSSFCHKIVKQSLGFDMLDMKQQFFITRDISNAAADDPLVVYRYDTAVEEKDSRAVSREIWDVLKPCDIVCYYRKAGGGHAVFYVGDLYGDGEKLVLESGGDSMNLDTGEDPRDRNGTVMLNPMETKIDEKAINKYARIVVLRPADMAQAHLTPAAASRLRYPGLELRKMFSQSCYWDVADGETITVTISVTNHGDADYQNLVITDPVPQGQNAENVLGGKLKNGTITWVLNVPKGETVTVGYDVTVHGAIGDTVAFESGLADGVLQTRAARFKIGGKHLSSEQEAHLFAQKDALLALAGEGLSATEFVNAAYRTAFGVTVQLPASTEALLDALIERCGDPDVPMFQAKTPQTAEETYLSDMVILNHLGGKQVQPQYLCGEYDDPQYLDVGSYVTAYWKNNYRPGDVFITVSGSGISMKKEQVCMQMILDDRSVLVYGFTLKGTPYAEIGRFDETVQKNLISRYVVALRPSQVGLFD